MLKCRLHVSGEVANVCQMLTQWWHWIIAVGFMVNLASWKDGDLFSPLCTQWRVSCRRPCHYFSSVFCDSDVNLFKFFQHSRVPRKSGMGVNSSNVDKRTRLIPCRCVSWVVRGNTVLPSLERSGTLHGESSMNYEWKTSATRYSWFWLSVWCSRREKGGNLGTHAHSFHSLYAE